MIFCSNIAFRVTSYRDTEDQARFKNVLDDNLVISRKIQAGTGITERTVEYVYFVFDECNS